MSDVTMVQLPNGSMPKNDGEFAWDETEQWCRMMLPGKNFVNLPSHLAPGSGPRWQWNGSLDRPTFTPSVRQFIPQKNGADVELWHGFITDGVMRSV